MKKLRILETAEIQSAYKSGFQEPWERFDVESGEATWYESPALDENEEEVVVRYLIKNPEAEEVEDSCDWSHYWVLRSENEELLGTEKDFEIV